MRTTTEYQGSILSLRGAQVHTMEGSSLEHELDSFQKTDHFLGVCHGIGLQQGSSKQLGTTFALLRPVNLWLSNALLCLFITMNSILLFTMWALVAAIPCQDRGLHLHFSIPRQLPWAAPVASLHERILEESKKRERKNLVAC
ncbi:Protein BYPASS-related [Sesbania bispinosa]|nr:Protein BYPASS-related [Sesbania bispinosa]